jgi:cell wall-associated NlpC family hydrolase
MLTRKSDWHIHLDKFLLAHGKTPFRYGEMDCSLFVFDAVHAMTGTDLAAPYRGRYHSRKQALALAKQHTGKASLRALLTAVLDPLPAVPVLLAQRGDIVLVRRGKHDVSIAIVSLDGRTILAASNTEGFVRLPLALGIRAWRV